MTSSACVRYVVLVSCEVGHLPSDKFLSLPSAKFLSLPSGKFLSLPTNDKNTDLTVPAPMFSASSMWTPTWNDWPVNIKSTWNSFEQKSSV